ncbi:MFS transporter [Rhizorhabdus dicambivorans]|uniref:MFS transporter n=1 Tax=Rhizorhabdus dicambivorans TaxID=1850238 RepID=UPI000831B452|nr:MFS transporter [Rhizorhabdus dicambivorans]
MQRSGISLVAAACAGIAFYTLYLYTLGVLIEPLQREFAWSRAGISAGLTIVSVATVLCSPFVGRLIDRIGARRIALAGVSLYSAALLALPLAGPSIESWWLGWAFVAAGAMLIQPTIWSAAVVSRFDRHRGIALAFTLSGSGIASFFGPALVDALARQYGWRIGYLTLGLVGLLFVLPLIWRVFFDARDLERLSGRPATSSRTSDGLSAAEGFRSRAFVQLALAGYLGTAAVTSLLVHFVPIVSGGGLDRSSAAYAAGVFGMAAIASRIGSGFLLDRMDGRWIGAFALGIPVLAPIIFLNYDGSFLWAVIAAAIIGVGVGAEIDALAILSARYFGLRNYGLLWGTIAGIVGLGSGTGPLVAGLIFDNTGSYDILFHMLIPLSAVVALLLISIPRDIEHGKRDQLPYP